VYDFFKVETGRFEKGAAGLGRALGLYRWLEREEMREEETDCRPGFKDVGTPGPAQQVKESQGRENGRRKKSGLGCATCDANGALDLSSLPFFLT